MNYKSFLKQLSYYVPAQIAPAIINLLIIMVLTRSLSIDDYGDYVLITTIITFTVTVITQWLIQSLMFYRPKYIEAHEVLEFDFHIKKIIRLFIIILISCVIMLVLLRILENYSPLVVIVLIIMVQSIFTLELAILQSSMQAKQYAMRIFLTTVIRFIGICFLAIFTETNTLTILIVLLVSYGIYIVPKLPSYIKFPYVETKQTTLVFLKTMLSYGFPMLGWFLCTAFMNLADRVIIKWFEGSEAVGVYSGNYSIISAALALVFAPLTMTIHPILMKLASESNMDIDKIESHVRRFTTIFFIVGLPIIMIVQFFRYEIALVFLGEQYVGGSDVIPIVMLGLFFWNLSMVGHKGLEIMKKTSTMFAFVLIACIVSVCSNLILVSNYSYTGAAIGNMLAFTTYCILVYIYSKSHIRWKFDMKSILIIVAATIFSAVILLLYQYDQNSSSVYLICKIAIFSMLYIVIYMLTMFVLVRFKVIKVKF